MNQSFLLSISVKRGLLRTYNRSIEQLSAGKFTKMNQQILIYLGEILECKMVDKNKTLKKDLQILNVFKEKLICGNVRVRVSWPSCISSYIIFIELLRS
jgi:hypothetical protein